MSTTGTTPSSSTQQQPLPTILLPTEVKELLATAISWDQVVQQLEQPPQCNGDGAGGGAGMALVDLPWDCCQAIPQRAFAVARQALHQIHDGGSSAGDEKSSSSCTTTTTTTTSTEKNQKSRVVLVRRIDTTQQNSAHATGYHPAGCSSNNSNNSSNNSSMSVYNLYREGFVFSNGEMIHLVTQQQQQEQKVGNDNNNGSDDENCSLEEFAPAMTTLHAYMHAIANHVLQALEQRMGLHPGWFAQYLQPGMNTSQWHVKNFVVAPPSSPTQLTITNATTTLSSSAESSSFRSIGKEKSSDDGPPQQDQQQQQQQQQQSPQQSPQQQQHHTTWLAMHTDPSIISIVIHNVEGKQPGGQGLQYAVKQAIPSSLIQQEQPPQDFGGVDSTSNSITSSSSTQQLQQQQQWVAVPFSGHAVAIVMTGSVLSYMTGGQWPACRHQVVATMSSSTCSTSRCMAATLFVRPAATAMLPKLHLQQQQPLLTNITTTTSTTTKQSRLITFETWVSRVARNYQKSAVTTTAKTTKSQNKEINQKQKQKLVTSRID